MKPNTPATTIIVTLLFLLVFQFIRNHKRVKRLERELTIEAAKTSFFSHQLDTKHPTSDSIRINGDTMLFFRNDSFIGKTIIETR